MRISTTVAGIGEVQREVQAAFANANATSFLSKFGARGVNATAAYIDSITSSLVRRAPIPVIPLAALQADRAV